MAAKPVQAQPIGLTIASHACGEIYFGIPKVATRSLLEWAETHRADLPDDLVIQDSTLAHALGLFDTMPRVTALVRNPYARALSTWADKIARLDRGGHRARRIARHKGLRAGMSFDDFTRWLAGPNGQDALSDRHWMSQSCFLDAAPEAVVLRLEVDLPKLRLFGRSIALPNANATGRRDADYTQAYSALSRDRIAGRYARDLVRYDYAFKTCNAPLIQHDIR